MNEASMLAIIKKKKNQITRVGFLTHL